MNKEPKGGFLVALSLSCTLISILLLFLTLSNKQALDSNQKALQAADKQRSAASVERKQTLCVLLIPQEQRQPALLQSKCGINPQT